MDSFAISGCIWQPAIVSGRIWIASGHFWIVREHICHIWLYLAILATLSGDLKGGAHDPIVFDPFSLDGSNHNSLYMAIAESRQAREDRSGWWPDTLERKWTHLPYLRASCSLQSLVDAFGSRGHTFRSCLEPLYIYRSTLSV